MILSFQFQRYIVPSQRQVPWYWVVILNTTSLGPSLSFNFACRIKMIENVSCLPLKFLWFQNHKWAAQNGSYTLPCLFWLTHQKVNHGLILEQWFCCPSLLQPGYVHSSSTAYSCRCFSATLILATMADLQHYQTELTVCHRIQLHFLLRGCFPRNSSLMKIIHLDSGRTNL